MSSSKLHTTVQYSDLAITIIKAGNVVVNALILKSSGKRPVIMVLYELLFRYMRVLYMR